MTSPTWQAQAETVKLAVASPATCSSLTVVTLEHLIWYNSTFAAIGSKISQAEAKIITAVKPKSRAGPHSKTRVKAKVTVFETSQSQELRLEPCDALLLATEVFNASLNTLTQATKPPAQPRREVSRKDLTTQPNCTSGTHSLVRHVSRLQQPLQPRSLNRLSSSPSKSSLRRSLSGTSNGPAPGLTAVAECARVALRALRCLHARGLQTNQMPLLQLENGMSALIGKLITLGLDDMAFKELCILKRRLDTTSDTGNQDKIQRQEMHSEKDTLDGLLLFERLEAGEREIALMVRVQMHALKLVASERLPSVVESAVHNMQQSISGSPIDLILRTSNQKSPPTVANAARQLEVLAHILMSCCPNISSCEDANIAHAKAGLPPRIAFEAQVLALEIRLQAWKLAGHKGDVQRQLYEPFAKCLTAYSRRCSDSALTKYNRVLGAFERLIAGHDSASSAQKHPSSTDYSLTTIYKTLGNMGEGASLLEEAIKWNIRCISFVRHSSSLGAVQGARACRVALLRLLMSNKTGVTEDLAGSLAEATESLNASLLGDSAELDELMLVAAALRKAAMAWITKSSPPSGEVCEGDQLPLKVRETCLQLVHTCLLFLTRYIGTTPAKDADSTKLARYDQRRELSSKVARGTVESVIAITKISLATGQITWERLDSALRDCVGLLSVLEGEGAFSDEPEARSTADKQLVFVKISNVYWSYYLKKKQASAPLRELLKSLQRSVDLIKRRTKLETSAGFLAVKLERLGALQESLGRFADALELYADAVRSHIATGVLLKASVAAQERSVVDVLEGEGAPGVLGKALSSWTKLAIKDDFTLRIPFDDETLPLDQRGLLLEWQLAVVSNLVDAKSTAASEGRSILALANLLLSIYRAETYPIRRLRLCLCLLRIEANHADVLGSTFMDELANELDNQSWQISTANDGGLTRYEQHLRACLTVSLAFRKGGPAGPTFLDALRVWSHTVDECQTWECLGDRVENRAEWTLQLQSIIDYLEMQGQETSRISALHLMARVRELQDPTDHSGFVRSVSDLGLQYSRLGYSGKAGHAIARAKKYVESCGVALEVRLRWYLAYAEYLVEIGNFEKSETYLTKAGQLAEEDTGLKKDIGSSTTLRGRVRLNRVIADAVYVHAQLAFARGKPDEALALAKRCVRLNYRAWSGLERQTASASKAMHPDSHELDHSGLNESFSLLSVSACYAPPIMSSTHDSLKSPPFWSLVPTIFRGLALLSRLFIHQGMFLEAVYYTEQAQKVVDAVGAMSWKAQSLALSGHHWTRCGYLQKGEDLLAQSRELSLGMAKNRGTAILCAQLATLHKARGNWDEEASAYRLAGKVLKGLTRNDFVESLEQVSPAMSGLEEQMEKLALGSARPSNVAIKKRQVQNPITDRIQSRSATVEKPVPNAQNFASQCIALLRLRGDLLRQHAFSLIFQQKIGDATLLLAEADELPKTQHGYIQQHLGTAKQLLLRALKDLSVDAVFCVLPDSTISFPAVTGTSTSKERQVCGRTPAKASKSSPPRKTAMKQGLRKTASTKTPILEDFRDVLYQARDSVSEVQTMAVQMSSTNTLHVISNVLRTVLILLSAASSATTKSTVNPYFATYSTEVGRIVALQRERLSIRLDQHHTPQEEMLRWPSIAAHSYLEPSELRMPLKCSSFQKDYVDIIPANWNVISVSLSESCDEIYITKLQGGLIPFMLRLPLSRHNSRDADEDIFGFEQGKTELVEIMDLANFSAQDARNMTGKEAKSQWWAEREALDERLKDLLTNIENIWLGGFRGVFARHLGRSHLLSRFQHSFQNILGKYLPSRQATNKRNRASPVCLDSRVLELFVGLAESADVSELEEPLTDLLYFVVDILQFHGERNAYDEVDFDSIIVETSDAIRCYQEAVQAEKAADATHTILILDKALHIFPWESLPCLDGQSVSRLPSLGCLRQRILLLQQQKAHEDDPHRFYVDRTNGAYVLNPSQDLKSTQTTFERPLECLPNWGSIVQREPSETELETALESGDIFLYFGHGSGAQYIRARTIKRLNRCAVSLLMGCSSGALTEAGEFEPYGTPINYMHAGCPALVATLWDVTDKDIDRFSYTVLDKWGLFKGTASEALKSPVKAGGKRAAAKRKAREEEEEEENSAAAGEPVSLVEAVAKGRSSCILRYLNGAAPVVYGIPVYLS